MSYAALGQLTVVTRAREAIAEAEAERQAMAPPPGGPAPGGPAWAPQGPGLILALLVGGGAALWFFWRRQR